MKRAKFGTPAFKRHKAIMDLLAITIPERTSCARTERGNIVTAEDFHGAPPRSLPKIVYEGFKPKAG